VALEELLRVLRDEAAREERATAERGVREAERIVAEARARTAELRAAALAREGAARADRLRGAREASALARERALLVEGRRQLGILRDRAAGRPSEGAPPVQLARWVEELLREAGPVASILVVDPGDAAEAARALDRLRPSPRPEVREAEAARGGVALLTGTLVLDATFPARLERAWSRAEPEIAALLFEGG
jgi:vacuolar-type H+-ATPase subunit E/Vma4